MSKRSRKHQMQRNQQILIAVVVGILVMIGGALLLNQNSAEGATSQNISPADYQSDFDSTQHVLLDVRTPAEFNEGHIEGAVNISVETLANRISEVPSDQPIVVYCRSGNRSAQAVDILSEAGYTNVYDMGGIIDWTAAGYPIVQ